MMKRKTVLFAGLSVLIILIGLPIILKQDWSKFSGGDKLRPASAEITIGYDRPEHRYHQSEKY